MASLSAPPRKSRQFSLCFFRIAVTPHPHTPEDSTLNSERLPPVICPYRLRDSMGSAIEGFHLF